MKYFFFRLSSMQLHSFRLLSTLLETGTLAFDKLFPFQNRLDWTIALLIQHRHQSVRTKNKVIICLFSLEVVIGPSFFGKSVLVIHFHIWHKCYRALHDRVFIKSERFENSLFLTFEVSFSFDVYLRATIGVACFSKDVTHAHFISVNLQ